MLIDFIKKMIQKLFSKKKKNKKYTEKFSDEVHCEKISYELSKQHQNADKEHIDDTISEQYQKEAKSPDECLSKIETYQDEEVAESSSKIEGEKIVGAVDEEDQIENVSEVEKESHIDSEIIEEHQAEELAENSLEIEEEKIVGAVDEEYKFENFSEVEKESNFGNEIVEEHKAEIENLVKVVSESKTAQNSAFEQFSQDRLKYVQEKIGAEKTDLNTKKSVIDQSKKYKTETAHKAKNKALSEKQINERDKKLKKWKKSIYDTDFSSDQLMEYIIDQMKDLRDKYSNNYPLGFVKLDKERYKELKTRCKRYVDSPPESFTPYNCLIISLTMIQFVIKEKKTSNFWNDFFASFGVEYDLAKRDSFCEALLYLCANERFYFDYLNGRRRYVETIKIHAVISEITITNVFDTIWSYYLEVMNAMYSDDTIESYAKDFLDIMKGSSDTEIYNIPLAFKKACEVFENAMLDCIENTLYNMNSKNYRMNISKKTPSAFYSHYMNWTIICEIRRRTQNKMPNDEKTVSESKRHYTKAEFSLGAKLELLIHIPKIEIPENMIDEEILLKFYNDGSEIYELRKNMNVVGMFRFYTEETEKVLPYLYKKLSYRVVAGKTIIYDSLKMMYRDFIVFDNSFDEYNSKKIPEDNFFLLTDKSDDVSLDCYNEVKRNDNIKIYALSAENDSELYINSSPVFRTFGDENVGIKLNGGKNIRGTKIITDGNVYNAWSELPDIVLSFENREKLDEYTFEVSKIKQGKLLDFIDERCCISLKEFSDIQDELHIIIKNKSGKVIWYYAAVFVPGYECSFDKEFYYKEKYAELLDIAADNMDFSQIEFPVICETESDYIYIDADKNGKNVKVQLSIPVISWRISDNINSKGDIYILGSELPNNAMLEVKAPFSDYKMVAANINGINSLKTKNGKSDISVLKTSNADYTSVGIVCHKVQVKLFEVIHKACIREFYINTFEERKQIEISYKLFGQAEVIITAIPYGEDNGKEIFRSDKSENRLISLELPSGRYRITAELEESDEFGFETQRKLAENREIFIGDEFETFCKSITELKIEKCLTDKELPISNFYLKNIRKVVDGYWYEGTAYFYALSKYTGEAYQQEFRQANPVIIRVLEVSDTEYKVLITDKELDGFLYNKSRKYLVYDDKRIKDKINFDTPDIYFITKNQRGIKK